MRSPNNENFINTLSDNRILRTPSEDLPERKTSFTFEELEEIYHQEKRLELYEKSKNVRVFAVCNTPALYSLPQPNLSFRYWADGYYKAHMITRDEMKADLRFMWATSASEAADIYFVCCLPSKISEAIVSVFDFEKSENSGNYLVRKSRIGKGQEYLGKNTMSENERSILLFLLDALRVSPEKAEELIKIVENKERSTHFQEKLDELHKSSDVLKTAAEMRQSLR